MSTKESWGSLKKQLEELFKLSLKAMVPTEDNLRPLIVECRYNSGDYECNAFNLFRKIKKIRPEFTSIEMVAEAIKKNLPESEIIENCFVESECVIVVVSRKWLATNIEKMLIEGIQSWAPRLPITRAVIHFTEPSDGDKMHGGHFRSTIISDSLSKILEFCGVEVLKRGRVDDSNKQGGEPKCQKARDQICETSHFESKNTYKRRRVKPDIKSNHPGVLDGFSNEALIEEEKGAQVCNPDIPVVSDGLSNKALIEDVPLFNLEQDLAVLRHYLKEEEAEWIIFVADDDLREDIRNLFYVAKQDGWHSGEDDAYPKITHAGYGLLGRDDGELFHLQHSLTDLFDKAKSQARKALEKQGIDEYLSPRELDKTAELLGHGSVRYFDLKWNRLCNYIFTLDEMLNLEDSGGVYILHKYSWVCSIIRELGIKDIKQLVNEDIEQLKKGEVLVLDRDYERVLGVHLLQFSEIVEDACSSLCPNIICNYGVHAYLTIKSLMCL